MRRIVFVTQRVDPDHPALAATIPKLRALAREVDEVVVLALEARPDVLPPNCRVLEFGAGGRVARTLRFALALRRALAGPRPVAVVAHMAPVYAVLAAPLVRPRRIPLLLWYTHWKATRTLRLAERLVTGVVSVDRRSFPLDSAKVVAIGHGIDVSEFGCRPSRPAGERLRVLALGRISPSKGYETMLRATRLLEDGGVAVSLRIVGPTLTDEERAHRAELERLRVELAVEEAVTFEDAVPRERVPELLGEADVLVNNMRAGAPDKVVYEAAASCVPVLASNPVFDALLPEALRFERDAPEQLAAALRAFHALGLDEAERLGAELRGRVEASHTAESWAAGLLAAASPR